MSVKSRCRARSDWDDAEYRCELGAGHAGPHRATASWTARPSDHTSAYTNQQMLLTWEDNPNFRPPPKRAPGSDRLLPQAWSEAVFRAAAFPPAGRR